jgi:hypothetical protein
MSESRKKAARRFRVGDRVSFHYGLRKITARIVEDRGPLGVQGRRLYRLRPLSVPQETGDVEMPEDELEAAPGPNEEGAAPLQFDIVYIRSGNTNNWVATTKRGAGYGPVKARGAVSYATAKSEGESPGEEQFAIVDVLMDTSRGTDMRSLLEEVRKLADARFRQEHPAAEIDHDDDAEREDF